MSHSQSNINLKVIRTYDKNNCNKVKLKNYKAPVWCSVYGIYCFKTNIVLKYSGYFYCPDSDIYGEVECMKGWKVYALNQKSKYYYFIDDRDIIKMS